MGKRTNIYISIKTWCSFIECIPVLTGTTEPVPVAARREDSGTEEISGGERRSYATARRRQGEQWTGTP